MKLTASLATDPVFIILSQLGDVLKVLGRLGDESALLEVLLLVGQVVCVAELVDLLGELLTGEMAERIDDPGGQLVLCKSDG